LAIKYIGNKLKNNKEFIIEAIKVNYKAYEYINEDLQDNKAVREVFDKYKVRLTYEEIEKLQDRAMDSLFIHNCRDDYAADRLKWYS